MHPAGCDDDPSLTLQLDTVFSGDTVISGDLVIQSNLVIQGTLTAAGGHAPSQDMPNVASGAFGFKQGTFHMHFETSAESSYTRGYDGSRLQIWAHGTGVLPCGARPPGLAPIYSRPLCALPTRANLLARKSPFAVQTTSCSLLFPT